MTGEKHRRKIWPILLTVLILLLVLFLYYLITSMFLHVSRYTLEAEVSKPVRIVQLTDLHNAEFGKNNARLAALVEEQKPDLIVMTGDMINRDDSNTEIVERLISDLAPIAPVYYSYGNHETTWESHSKRDLHKIFSDAGAVVLECEYSDVEIKGQPLRIGGYMAFWGQPHMMTSDPAEKQREYDFFYDMTDTDRYTILLNHIPTQWVDWNYIDNTSLDLVFCGHYHGGVVRIPIIDRGVFAPYVGWFPPKTKGVFEGTDAVCVLSAGLGNEYHIPRWNNPPEIVVVDLVPGN